MQKAGRGEDKVGLTICARKSGFVLEIARMYREDRRILLARVVDSLMIPKRCIWVEEVIRAGRKGYPLMVRGMLAI